MSNSAQQFSWLHRGTSEIFPNKPESTSPESNLGQRIKVVTLCESSKHRFHGIKPLYRVQQYLHYATDIQIYENKSQLLNTIKHNVLT